ncbi:MAG: branched-chain amino acid ABC transporter permease [Actinomycetales bacterium]|uniref:Branched-chain amino acid ABC transporter permease n=1 Tax=Candidatus Phosphoribacter hodrii TaxID=2953743 RepID=A0A934X4G2_9MICO|nr:branched-chain amino acid ABC transporter permease [Candidatus Phosphoribacter hodrii]
MTTTQSRAAVSNPRPSSQWLLTLVGAVLLVVGCLLPWAFVPAILGNVTVLLYPGAMQILMIIVGAIAVFFLLLRTGRFAAADRLLDSARGLRALSVTAAAFMVLAVVIIAMQAPGLANADPGVYVSLVGALLMVAGSFRMPSDPKVDPITVHLPSWVEIVVIVVMLAIALFGAAYALGQEDGTIFSLFLLFLAGSVVALARAGLFSWIGVIAQRNRRVITLGAFAVAFLFPFTQNGSDANMSIATQVLIFATTALGLNIVVGLAGLLDLGYIAFLGAGAYVSAMMSHSAFATIGWKPPFIVVVVIAACVSSILGLIIGSPTLRVSGDYLAIVTLAFGEIFRLTVNNLDGNNGPDLTNGPNGIPGIPELEIGSFNFGDTHTLLGIPLGRFANYYFLMLVVAAIIITIFTRLNNSRIGRGWVAIREDEKAAEAMGVNVFGLKLFAFAGGAFLAGMAGSIKAHQDVSVTPDQYIFLESAFLLAAIVLGGMGTVAGVLVGATVLKLLPEKLRFVADYRLLTFGLLLVLMMRFRPEGLVPSRRRALEFHEDDTKLAERIEEAHLEGMTKTEGRA